MTDSTEDLSDALTANYLLASVYIRTWGAEKGDADVARETEAQKGAAQGSTTVKKSLLHANDKELKHARGAYLKLRTYFYDATVPWSINRGQKGDGLIGVGDAMKFMTHFANLKRDAEQAREDFLAVYHARAASARIALGGLHKASDYPSVQEVRDAFGASMTLRPLPAVQDFTRVNVPARLAEGLQQRYALQAQAQVDNAVTDVRDRLSTELARMHERLSKVANGEEKTRLYGTVISNMQDLVGIAKSMAPVSPELGVIAKRIEADLLQHKIEAFKGNAALSRSVAGKADAIHKALTTTTTTTATAFTESGEVGEAREANSSTGTASPEPIGDADEPVAITSAAPEYKEEQLEIPDFEELI